MSLPPFKEPVNTTSGENPQSSASSELGEAGLPEELMEQEPNCSCPLLPRKNADKRKVERVVKPVMPYFTGTAKPLTLFPSKVLSVAAEKANAVAAITDGIRSALLMEPLENQRKTTSPNDKAQGKETKKWSRPELEEGEEYDPEDFEEVKADCPSLMNRELAVLDADRDEPLWERPENPDEYYELWADEIRVFMRKCKLLEIPIDRSLRHLHSHCGHNVQQAIATIGKRAVNMVLWKPLNEREQSIFEDVYLAHGKNFHKIGKFLPHIPILRIVQHYYKSKKQFQYKKRLMGQTEKVNDALVACCSICKRKCRKLQTFQRFAGDECPRQICEICRGNRRKLMKKTEADEALFGGDFDQEVRLPSNFDGLSPQQAYHSNRRKVEYHIDYPSDVKELVDNFLRPNLEEVSSITLREQQRLLSLGHTGPRLDIARELDDNFFDNLKNMFTETLPDREEEEKKMRESIAANKKECKRLLEEMMAKGVLDEDPTPYFKDTPLGKSLKKMKKPKKMEPTEEFSEEDYKITLKTFMRYGVDFKLAAEIVRNKTPEMVEQFYRKYKASFDQFLKPYHGKEAIDSFLERMKADRPEMLWYYEKHLKGEDDADGAT